MKFSTILNFLYIIIIINPVSSSNSNSNETRDTIASSSTYRRAGSIVTITKNSIFRSNSSGSRSSSSSIPTKPVVVASQNYSFMDQLDSRTAEEKNKILPYKFCHALLHSNHPYKTENLKQYRDESNSPLLFWHVQKAGGSSFCRMARTFYTTTKRRIKMDNMNCNSDKYKEIVKNIDTWNQTYRPQGYRMFSVEPSDAEMHTFPMKYHLSPATLTLLNSSYDSKANYDAWHKIVHVIALRNPVELSLSAFNYQFPGEEISITSTCRDRHLSMDSCMQECFKIAENLTITGIAPNKHPFFNAAQIKRIRSEVLGNYTINHLSLINSLTGK